MTAASARRPISSAIASRMGSWSSAGSRSETSASSAPNAASASTSRWATGRGSTIFRSSPTATRCRRPSHGAALLRCQPRCDWHELPQRERRRRRAWLFGALHLGLIYVMGYLLMLAAAPAATLTSGRLPIRGSGLGGSGGVRVGANHRPVVLRSARGRQAVRHRQDPAGHLPAGERRVSAQVVHGLSPDHDARAHVASVRHALPAAPVAPARCHDRQARRNIYRGSRLSRPAHGGRREFSCRWRDDRRQADPSRPGRDPREPHRPARLRGQRSTGAARGGPRQRMPLGGGIHPAQRPSATCRMGPAGWDRPRSCCLGHSRIARSRTARRISRRDRSSCNAC